MGGNMFTWKRVVAISHPLFFPCYSPSVPFYFCISVWSFQYCCIAILQSFWLSISLCFCLAFLLSCSRSDFQYLCLSVLLSYFLAVLQFCYFTILLLSCRSIHHLYLSCFLVLLYTVFPSLCVLLFLSLYIFVFLRFRLSTILLSIFLSS